MSVMLLLLQISALLGYPTALWLLLVVFLMVLVWYNRKFYTRKRRLEQEIARQKQLVKAQAGKLAGSDAASQDLLVHLLAHLQQPLSSMINLNCAIMQSRLGTANVNIKGASSMAVKNGRQLLRWIEGVLELTSISEAKQQGDWVPVAFYSYIIQLYRAQLSLAKDRHIHLSLNYQLRKDLKIMLNPGILGWIFELLVGHALSASPVGSQVLILLESNESGDRIKLQVEDSGRGLGKGNRVPQGEKQRRDTQRVGWYFGFMPALVQRYAQLLDGEFSMNREAGRGTIYVFSFPNTAPPLGGKPAACQPGPAGSTVDFQQLLPQQGASFEESLPLKANEVKKYRGLIVSNCEEMLGDVQRTLKNSCHVLFARESQEMLELLARYKRKIDFIICRGELLFANGFQLLREVKSNEYWARLPILVFTEEVKASFRIRSFQQGIDDYVMIPAQADELPRRVEKLLNLRLEKDEWHVQEHTPLRQQVQVAAADLAWLISLEETIEEEMRNRLFNLGELAYRMAISERQLFRKVKELTGKTPNKYLKDLRLAQAKKLLENFTYHTVAEVSYAVGFQDPHYFSKMYKSQYGKWPADYLLKTGLTHQA